MTDPNIATRAKKKALPSLVGHFVQKCYSHQWSNSQQRNIVGQRTGNTDTILLYSNLFHTRMGFPLLPLFFYNCVYSKWQSSIKEQGVCVYVWGGDQVASLLLHFVLTLFLFHKCESQLNGSHNYPDDS